MKRPDRKKLIKECDDHPLLKSLGAKPRRGTVFVCPVCGKDFYRKPSDAKKDKSKRCSEACHHAAMRTNDPLACEWCGKEYYRPKSQVLWRGSSTCSRACLGKLKTQRQSGENNCLWKGGISSVGRRLRASSKWKAWRNAVFTRDNWTCQQCGARNHDGNGGTIALHPHHIKPFSMYPDVRFDVNNGITYCVDCHRQEHTGPLHGMVGK